MKKIICNLFIIYSLSFAFSQTAAAAWPGDGWRSSVVVGVSTCTYYYSLYKNGLVVKSHAVTVGKTNFMCDRSYWSPM